MSGAAVAMMILAMTIIWGGLAAAIVNLKRGGGPDSGAHRDL